MKHIMKRLLTVLICIVMITSLFPMGSFAWGEEQSEGSTGVLRNNINESTDGMEGLIFNEDRSSGKSQDEALLFTGGASTNSIDNNEAYTDSGDASIAGTDEDVIEGSGKLLYLSDIPTSKMLKCTVGWGTYTRDKNLDGKSITLIVNGSWSAFDKGVTAHADADLIYDLGNNYNDYDYFEAYIGVDAYRYKNGQVVFSFYKSQNGYNWTEITYDYRNTRFRGNTNAEKVKFNINGYRYFRVMVDDDGADTADHATLADAKFYSEETYVRPQISFLKTADYYSNKISGKTYEEIFASEELELALLQYRFMRLYGYEKLEYFLTSGDDYRKRIAAYKWLFNDYEALKEYLNGGIPINSNYLGALDVLADLYAEYATDMADTTALRAPDAEHASDTRGDLYRRMMLTMSLVCADGWSAWLARAGVANPVNRYAYFKENYDKEKMRDEIFENLGVDEMRWVIGNNISDAEIVWLNDYARTHPKGGNQTWYPILYSPHHHISYRWYNYDKDEYYSEDNRELYTERYMLSGYESYGLTYGLAADGTKVQRLWMVFADGAVCGNISRTGANLAACFGVPACEVGQPGHAAFCIMNRNSKGEMTWGIDNDISGWWESSNSRRMPADWGTDWDGWSSGYKAQYVLISQAALNDYDNYCKAEEVLMLCDLASTFSEKETVYRKALQYMPYHLDAWVGLIQLYVNDSSKTATELTELANELCSQSSKVYLYPKTLDDLTKLILTRLNKILTNTTDTTARELVEAEIARCNLIFRNALVRATQATSADCTQPDYSRNIANNYLNSSTYKLAEFSFDGENANSLVFAETFTGVRFRICLNYTDDGEDNEVWIPYVIYAEEGKQAVYQLSDSEKQQISPDSDIYIWLDGWPSSDGNPDITKAYKIDITKGTAVAGIEFNDNENRFLGDVYNMEFSTDQGNTWEELTNETLFEGRQSILVHKKATGTTLQGTDTPYESYEDNTDTRAYISIKRLKLAGYSSEETSKNDYAIHAIDGLMSTRWHNLWNGSDKAKYITIMTDEPTYFSGVDYTPVGGNGTITNGQIYVSMDGESWIPAGTITNWKNDSTKKAISFNPVYGQYLKIVVTGSQNGFVSARKIELFEDRTMTDKEIIGISLLSLPNKREYYKGEKLDLTGAAAKLVYSDYSYSVLPIEMLVPDTEVLNVIGLKAITLTYGSFAPVTFHVNVKAREMTPTSIRVVRLPERTEYYSDDEVDTSGMLVTATDGSVTVYLSTDEYTVEADFTKVGQAVATVTMKDTSLTAEFDITVKKAITSLVVEQEPNKKVYELGDHLDATGLIVYAEYEDGTREVLEEDRYYLKNTVIFSEEEGNPMIPVVLADKESIQTSFQVIVYPYFTRNGTRYSADKHTHTCYVVSVGSSEEFVSIPESVRLGSRVYKVTGIGPDVMGDNNSVRAVSLPGTITNISENAFSNCNKLEQVYLTAHTGFDDLQVADNSFNTDIEIILYAANEELSKELGSKSYAEDMKVGNVAKLITGIQVTPPYVTVVSRLSEPDFDGYSVSAILEDERVVPLDKSTCTKPELDTKTSGEKQVAITLIGTEFTAMFTMTVQNSMLRIITNPVSALYVTKDAVVEPLSVGVYSDNIKDEYEYQWYRSGNGTIDYETDIIEGATAPKYVPTESGFYYVRVCIKDTDLRVFSLAAEVCIGDYTAIIGSKGYDSLREAVNEAVSGDTIEILKNITLSSGITINKNITIVGNDHTIIRGIGFTGTMITVTAGTFSAVNLVLDGGAGWYGEIHKQLLRGCQSSGTIAYGPIIRASGSSSVILGNQTFLQNNYNMANQTKNTTAGAIYAENSARIELTGTSITDNYSHLFGSAIYHRDSTTLVINEGCFFHGNSGSAQYNTSVICDDNNSTCIVNGGTFCHNVGAAAGGVFWVSNGSLTINGGRFTNNISSKGETLFLNGSAKVTINGFEEIEGIYLKSNRTVTIGNVLPENSINIVTENKTERIEAVKPGAGLNADEIQKSVTVNGVNPGVNEAGNLTLPCSDHTESENWIVGREATCSVKGEEYKYCTTCKARTTTRDIECIAHTPEAVGRVEPTCHETGTEEGERCAICKETLTGMKEIPVLEHEYTISCTKEPGCTVEGERCHTCIHCHDSYTEPVDMLGHDMVVTIITYPTNKKTGLENHTCSRCGETYDLEIPLLKYLSGDINQDGTVNMKDIVRLMKYLLGEEVEVETNALDVNGDGKKNLKDIVRLIKYISGESVEIN